MPAGLATREEARTTQTVVTPIPVVRRVDPEVRPEKKIAMFLLGATLTVFAFWLYGGHSPTAEIIRKSTPTHIYHQNYYDSGTS